MIEKSLGIILIVSAIGGIGHADSILVPASKDNTLYQNATGDLSNGSGQYFFAGTNGDGAIRRGLLAFDVAGIVPPGSTVTSASLRLYMSRTPAATGGIELHRALADWGEGASVAPGEQGAGGAAQTGDATWLYRFYNTSTWAQPGGDFDPTPSASALV